MRNYITSMLLGATMMAGATAASAQAPETDTLSISIGVDLPFLVHVVAREKGMFEEAGFTEVTFQKFQSGSRPLDAPVI